MRRTLTMAFLWHTRAHYDQVDQALVAAAGHVSGELAGEPPEEGALVAMLVGPTNPEVSVRAYGPDGRALASSPGAPGRPTPGTRPGSRPRAGACRG